MEESKRMKQLAQEALEIIMKQDRCSPTEVSFGYVDKDNRCRDGLVIKKCAPIIIKVLVEAGFCLAMTHEGLLVEHRFNPV